ncbi:PotD/PotF family extracellular solute-binding protein [Mesorhizobium sp. BAC0120]|uniref:ABC transporter substrate-binding protein n=1 Tax=Mesorhizobium sp. BAC0120 TaxID=3090670 RepID=UPI00298BDD65|nr:PotD/PotF family extracellular solute-binding protein [Mesorhizobium sp. BAC0120]MDW6023321.1 PotD/PotF family extracellular solute-binding protein [Mesorhizobium sp. BAC0120]
MFDGIGRKGLATPISRRAALAGLAGMTAGATLVRMSSWAQAAPTGELQVMAWEGYDLNAQLTDWKAANGISIEATSIANQDDVQAKFVAGNPPPIDLAEYNQAYADLYIREMKIVTPIDVAQVPNYNADNLFAQFYDQPTWFADGKLWGSPYVWGFNTLLYNKDKLATPKSYKDLLDPALKGKIAIMDDTVSSWPVAARVAGLGAKYPLLTKEELTQAFTEFAKYRDQARVIALNQGELLNLMVSGEVVAALCADPSILIQAEQQNVKIEMALPEEGPVLWVDAWFIPISADNIEAANAFINQSLDPKVQAEVAMAVVQAPVSKKAVELLDEKSRARIDYSAIDKIFASGLPGIPPRASDTHATYDDWVAAWQEFKAGM